MTELRCGGLTKSGGGTRLGLCLRTGSLFTRHRRAPGPEFGPEGKNNYHTKEPGLLLDPCSVGYSFLFFSFSETSHFEKGQL